MALGFMRRHRRWLYVFLWLVIGAFIVLYFPAFQQAGAGSPAETLGEVGGLPITVAEFQRNYQRQRQMYERMYQGRMDAGMLKSLGLEDQAFEALVQERLVTLEAERLGVSVDDQTLARALANAPELQENGKFIGAAELRRRLDQRGLSIREFEESYRSNLLRERLQNLVTDGVGVTPAEIEREFRQRNEQVKLEYVLVDQAPFRAQSTATDDEIKARFEANKESYRVPEKRVVSYLLVDTDQLRSRVTVTDRDLEVYHRDHSDEFKQPEEVCAHHILIKVKTSPEAKEGHEENEAKKIAQGILDQVKAGADFLELAKRSSEDKGSAPDGGDLRCFPRGNMVPEFENVAFSLSPGETSDLVKSTYGYHIIRLDSRKDESVAPLTLVKDRIRETVTSQRVRDLARDKVREVTQTLRRGRSLEAAAQEHGLTVQKSAPLARGAETPPLTSALLVARAFELKKGDIDADGFNIAKGYAFIALAEVLPAHVPDLPEVRDKVKSDVEDEKARAFARDKAILVKVQSEKIGLDKAASANGLVRKETPSLVNRGTPLGDLGSAFDLDEAVFSLPEKVVSGPVSVPAGFAVVRVLEKKSIDAGALESQRSSLTASLKAEKRNQLFQAFLRESRQRFPIERREEAFRRVVAS